MNYRTLLRSARQAFALYLAHRGGDHFLVEVTSSRFDGLSLLEQHKLVYAAVQSRLDDGSIHRFRAHAVVLATGGYGNVFFLSTNAISP